MSITIFINIFSSRLSDLLKRLCVCSVTFGFIAVVNKIVKIEFEIFFVRNLHHEKLKNKINNKSLMKMKSLALFPTERLYSQRMEQIRKW